MYPASFFGLVPPFPRNRKVFVAMSFDPRFDDRWVNVISPAVSSVACDGESLQPYRVDMSRVSDSILTEILDGVSTSRLVLADISCLGELEGRPVRNANVMYEVGLAHATRLPEEVILLRSDDHEISFDVAGVRVHHYDPDDDPNQARGVLASLLSGALEELDLRRSLSVRRVAEAMDINCWVLLLEAVDLGRVQHPSMATMGQVLTGVDRVRALAKLLDLGVLTVSFNRVTLESAQRLRDGDMSVLGEYGITEFGAAVAGHGVECMDLVRSPQPPA